MDVPDSVIGKVVLVSTTTVFVLLAVWVNTYPFIDEESPVIRIWNYTATFVTIIISVTCYVLYTKSVILSYVPAPTWFLVGCAVWGLGFIGGLMAFSLYHLYPYL